MRKDCHGEATTRSGGHRARRGDGRGLEDQGFRGWLLREAKASGLLDVMRERILLGQPQCGRSGLLGARR